jgi:transposase
LWTDKNRAKYDRNHLRYSSDLTDDEWAYVEPLIPPARRGGGKRRTDMRAGHERRDVHPEHRLPMAVHPKRLSAGAAALEPLREQWQPTVKLGGTSMADQQAL